MMKIMKKMAKKCGREETGRINKQQELSIMHNDDDWHSHVSSEERDVTPREAAWPVAELY